MSTENAFGYPVPERSRPDVLWEAAQAKAAAENTTVSDKIREFLEPWTGEQL